VGIELGKCVGLIDKVTFQLSIELQCQFLDMELIITMGSVYLDY
jgi:hypothetical protein